MGPPVIFFKGGEERYGYLQLEKETLGNKKVTITKKKKGKFSPPKPKETK